MYQEGGVIYFEPDSAKYGRIRPVVSKLARRAPIQRLLEAAHHRGMSVDGWVVSLHNSRLGARHPNHCQTTAVGGALLHALCPANPHVRQFAQALAADTASLGVDGIELETVCYQPFEHGSHHERSVYRLDGFVRFMLGLCFCTWCLERAGRDGVDGERLRRFVAGEVDRAFGDDQQGRTAWPSNEVEVATLCDGEMGRYLAVRRSTVASLVQEIADASRSIAPGVRVTYLDPSAALLGYATGRPETTEAAAATGWQHGIDPRLVVRGVDEIGVPAYFAEHRRFRREIEAYQDLCDGRVKVILRPMPPDVRSRAGLVQRMRILRDLGISRVAFYHYGLMPLESLGWIRAATQLGRPHRSPPPWQSEHALQGTTGSGDRPTRRSVGE